MTRLQFRINPVDGYGLLCGYTGGSIYCSRTFDGGLSYGTGNVVVSDASDTGFGLELTMQAANPWIIYYVDTSGVEHAMVSDSIAQTWVDASTL